MFIGLLDLKKEAIVGVDGQSIVLKTDDFLGICNVDSDCFHLVTVRGHSESTLATGFALSFNKKKYNTQSSSISIPSSFIRKYDEYTEEMSAKPVDKLTADNLIQQLPQLLSSPPDPSSSSNHRVVGYTNIVPDSQFEQWKTQTNFIIPSGILEIRGISNGEKIVPGSYDDNDDDGNGDDGKTLSSNHKQEDGKSLSYPPIPVVDPKLSIWQTKHSGTKRYLQQLSPSDRTLLFVSNSNNNDTTSSSSIANRLFQDVLQSYYNGQWQTMMGDLQLSYTLFLYLQCFSSFEHWKDLIAMICLVDVKGIVEQSNFYHSLMTVLPAQIITMEKGFLEDMDEAGNNFLLPLLKQLCQTLSKSKVVDEEQWSSFQSLLMNRFPNSFVYQSHDYNDTANNSSHHHLMEEAMDWDVGDDHYGDDEDGPVIVSTEDIQASLARSSATSFRQQQQQQQQHAKSDIPMEVKTAYPLLVASIMPQEDILMTCARALDDARDVSLVREAAAYLEEVEQQK